MPPPFPIVKSVSFVADVAMVAATETVVATLPGITLPDPTMIVTLTGRANVLTQAGGTTVTPRIRRVGVAGTLVGEGDVVNVGAVLAGDIPISADDQPGDVASLAYVLTMTSAVGNATAVEGSLSALIHT